MEDKAAPRAPASAHDLSDALTAAIAAASGRVRDPADPAYVDALEKARKARTEGELADALAAVRAVGR